MVKLLCTLTLLAGVAVGPVAASAPSSASASVAGPTVHKPTGGCIDCW